MKRGLLMLVAVPLMFLFSNCNKEILEGEYDLNNDGTSEMVWSKRSNNDYILFSPKGTLDIDTIFNFGKRAPDMWGFNYENEDNYLDLYFYRSKGEDLDRYVVYSKKGVLLRKKVEKDNK